MMKVIYLIGALVSVSSFAEGVCYLERTWSPSGHEWVVEHPGHAIPDARYRDCDSSIDRLKSAEDAGRCTVDWNITRDNTPSNSSCRKMVDAVIASKNGSSNPKGVAKAASSSSCESVTETEAVCQGRHYKRDLKSVADKRNSVRQVLERAASSNKAAGEPAVSDHMAK